jgi:hypothetical protein
MTRTAPPEVWKEIDAEIEAYIKQWKEAVADHLKSLHSSGQATESDEPKTLDKSGQVE